MALGFVFLVLQVVCPEVLVKVVCKPHVAHP